MQQAGGLTVRPISTPNYMEAGVGLQHRRVRIVRLQVDLIVGQERTLGQTDRVLAVELNDALALLHNVEVIGAESANRMSFALYHARPNSGRGAGKLKQSKNKCSTQRCARGRKWGISGGLAWPQGEGKTDPQYDPQHASVHYLLLLR